MSGIKTSQGMIARRYGGVLFHLVQEEKERQKAIQDIDYLYHSLQAEPREWACIASPSLPLHKQDQLVEESVSALQLGKLLHQFLRILCHYRRLPLLNLILEEFFRRVKKAEGIVEGVIETSTELSTKELKALQEALQAQLGQHVSLRQHIKKNLLGGVILRIGSLMIDMSTRTWLKKLRYVMKG